MAVDLDSSGRLPPGIHRFTWQELVDQFGWNESRRQLLAGLHGALTALKSAGCRTVYIDGSFVTEKELPADFDGCWDRAGVVLRKLLDTPLWTFDRGRAAQKKAYGGELFPADAQADAAGRRFLDFFQVDRTTGERKDIVVLDLGSLP